MDAFEEALKRKKRWYRFLFLVLPSIVIGIGIFVLIPATMSRWWAFDRILRGVVDQWYVPCFFGLILWGSYTIALKESIARLRLRYCRCYKCGYDIRSSGVKCPECGYVENPADWFPYHMSKERLGLWLKEHAKQSNNENKKASP